ncbi:MAG: bifunctional [glutamate--ammonia ligase]-adenylyl-L-tyrosine phosphorylase/[glutamate--ammonia-ligase] adenylyltransferase [Pseudomonadota bacterium]
MKVSERFEADMKMLPNMLRMEAEHLLQRLIETVPDSSTDYFSTIPSGVAESLPRVWAFSPFIASSCIRYPNLLKTQLTEPMSKPSVQRLSDELQGTSDDADFMLRLRRFRQAEMVRIAWRDLAGWAALEETLTALSGLADAALNAALNYYTEKLSERFGQPCNVEGQEQPLIIMAMGKLGGGELNFSSDIDIIFAYPEPGETRGGRRTLDNQEFFIRLAQKVVQALDNITADGFVFRVDTRLRPFGDSGPLVMHFAALEDYYQAQAREWERYACIKARIVNTDAPAAKAQLEDILTPFVYRRYLDFGAIESLRDLKTQINQEIRRKGYENDIKLGAGGIREIEFICQVFQLIRGGREPRLQCRSLLQTLDILEEDQHLTEQDATGLRDAYHFLRLAENRLQAINDQQTQQLPTDELNQMRLAHAMGFTQWPDFMNALDIHRAHVQHQFGELFGDTQQVEEIDDVQEIALPTVWQSLQDNQEGVLSTLQTHNFEDIQAALETLLRLKNTYAVRHLSEQGQKRLDTLMPMVLEQFDSCQQKTETLRRMVGLIEAIAQRSVYLSLLIEHPQALAELIKLFEGSRWIAEQITRYPLLLDELLDKRRLYDILDSSLLDTEIREQLDVLLAEDLEAQMDCLRHFKRAQVLHVAAAELTKRISVEVASDYLGAIADSIVRHSLLLAWQQMTEKHGEPMYTDTHGEPQRATFAIVAYGKAGGIEMSHSSDLDIIFLYDSPGNNQYTNGRKSLDNSVFFARLASRITHIMSTQTAAGTLYEIDTRLRPSGKAGMLVSRIDAFRDYQLNEAWTWEHQALVRARAIAGDESLMEQFEVVRRELLQLPRDIPSLHDEIIKMRKRMRDNLDKTEADIFNLKQGVGGVTDIEFIVQYMVLQHASAHAELLETTGVLPAFKILETADLLAKDTCFQLSEAYRVYRTETHRLALRSQPAYVDAAQFVEHRQHVEHWWNEILLNQ